jgi:hypothetical protein
MIVGFMTTLLLLQPVPDEAVTVLGTEFYAYDEDDPAISAVRTRRIPHRPESSCYLWVIRVAPADRILRVREILTLPAPSPTWDVGDERTQISVDGREAVTELRQDMSNGLLTNDWCIAERDPIGPYRIEVYDGARLLHRFEFQVESVDPSISSTHAGTSRLAAPVRVSWK